MVERLASILNVDPGHLGFGTSASYAAPPYDAPQIDSWVLDDNDQLSEVITKKTGVKLSPEAMVELSNDALSFALRRGDLLIIDKAVDRVRGDGRLYAVRAVGGEISVVRSELLLETHSQKLRLSLGHGPDVEVDPRKVEALGLVKASVRFE